MIFQVFFHLFHGIFMLLGSKQALKSKNWDLPKALEAFASLGRLGWYSERTVAQVRLGVEAFHCCSGDFSSIFHRFPAIFQRFPWIFNEFSTISPCFHRFSIDVQWISIHFPRFSSIFQPFSSPCWDFSGCTSWRGPH